MSARQILVDTGPLVAMLDRADGNHDRCAALTRNLPAPLLTCWPVVTEAMWLVRGSAAAQRQLLDAFNTGLLGLLPLDESAAPALQSLLLRYTSLRPQLADLCLVHLAHREGIRTIFTLDRRDFNVYRFKGKSSFHLIPE